jgi:hypothetical protein
LKAAKIHDEIPNGDPVEKQEEMDRMRQHVMKEFDKNNDRMLSFDEFEHGINGTEAKNDQGWKVRYSNSLLCIKILERILRVRLTTKGEHFRCNIHLYINLFLVS